MSSSAPVSPTLDATIRAAILAKPDAVLDDQSVMNALVSAKEHAMGSNIVDLRGIAMERMETRLDQLEDTYRSVVAAASENIAGTNQIHRAILSLLEPQDFKSFLNALQGPVKDVLQVNCITLVLESAQAQDAHPLSGFEDILKIVTPGFVESYTTEGRGGAARVVTLRPLQTGSAAIYGAIAAEIHSEAVMELDFGNGRLPAMLIFGSTSPDQFTPQHGTDLLTFFAGVFERSMRSWLS
ncbi:DUF484 family protein [Epibacterium ulvae]|uniref:DUF484 family protein n=1 Tax=Epibacterium ulvae TaxID=1156985 RepID=UPI00249194BB|nr:DUF484 family protein [Epibacterium ulvae]